MPPLNQLLSMDDALRATYDAHQASPYEPTELEIAFAVMLCALLAEPKNRQLRGEEGEVAAKNRVALFATLVAISNEKDRARTFMANMLLAAISNRVADAAVHASWFKIDARIRRLLEANDATD